MTHWVPRRQGWQRQALRRARVSAYECHYCERTGGSRTKDHKLARIFGGGGEADNMALCCKMCNMIKGARPYDEFVRVFREFLDAHGEEFRASNPDDGASVRMMVRKFNRWMRAMQNAGTVSG